VRIDLHTHSSASDGTDSPADLVCEAKAAGLDVVALTDHDAMSGWDEARDAADEVGIELVPGLEISTRFRHRGVHLLAYLPDPSYPPLVEVLDRILAGRTERTPAIVAALRAHGVDITGTTYAASPAARSPPAGRTSPTRSSGSASRPTAPRRSARCSIPAARATSTATPRRWRR
jgi:predicted metal-dependent phosphoesterase TrpH